MRQNTAMYENMRMFFVTLLYVSFGCFCALVLYNIVTWGDHLDYLLAAGAVVGVALIGIIITSI